MNARPLCVALPLALGGCASIAPGAGAVADVTVIDLGPMPAASAPPAEEAKEAEPAPRAVATLASADLGALEEALGDSDLAPGGGLVGNAGGLPAGGLGASVLQPGAGLPGPVGVTLGPAVVSGPFPGALVELVVTRRLAELDVCRKRGAAKTGRLPPSLDVRFRIEASGATSGVAIAGASGADPDLSACVVATFRALRFPSIATQAASVRLPLILSPAPKPRAPAAPVAPRGGP